MVTDLQQDARQNSEARGAVNVAGRDVPRAGRHDRPITLVERGARFRAKKCPRQAAAFAAVTLKLFDGRDESGRMFAQVSYPIRICKTVETYQKGLSVWPGSLGAVSIAGRVPNNQCPDPAQPPIVVHPNDIVLVKRGALPVESTGPAIEQRRGLGQDIGVEVGVALRVPNPVS